MADNSGLFRGSLTEVNPMKTITSMNFSEAVHASPHFILRAPCHIINIEDRDKDGYTALHHVASQSY